MHINTIVFALILTITVVNFIAYGYAYYSMTKVADKKTGNEMLTAEQAMVYTQLATHTLATVLTAGAFGYSFYMSKGGTGFR